jgi:ATP-binding cassette subfamily B protein
MVQRAVLGLREQVQAKLSRLPLSYFDRQPRGEILSRVTNDIDNLQQSVQQTLSQLVTSLLTIIGVLALMFIVSWQLALIALVTIPASVWGTRQLAKRAQPQFIKQWRYTGQLNAHVEEMYTGHALVTAFGQRDEAIATFTEQNEALYQASSRAQFISGTIQPLMMFMSNLNYVLVAVVGGLLIADGSLTLGAVTAFIQYSRQFSQPLTQVASMANLLQSSVASAERVFALLDAAEQAPDAAAPARTADVRGLVEFDDVSFRYLPDRPLIEHVSLTVQPGQTVAIVGPTGAGKTTLVNLLMRFYEIDSGAILLDGVDTAQMSRAELRALTGMVLQDAWLFGGTIADNIAYGSLGATREQVTEAARATYVDRFVRTLPDGYDTVLDDEGTNVSAGERQLITIARAFLARPAVLILDEATSSVDTRTEVLIQRAMASLRQGRTSFVIAHRLSTIRDADVILVMEDGHIVEQWNHQSLLAAGGAYARLYQAQFAQAAEQVSCPDPGRGPRLRRPEPGALRGHDRAPEAGLGLGADRVRRRPGHVAAARVLVERLPLGREQLEYPLVDAVLGEQPVHVHPADLAHPVGAGNRLVLGRRRELGLGDDDDRRGLDVQAHPARLDLRDQHRRAAGTGELVHHCLAVGG